MMERKLPAIRFFGCPQDHTGYGNATINMCKSLSRANIDVKFDLSRGKESLLEGSLKEYDGPCKIDLYMHTPPFKTHRSRNYKIGYFYWEADTLPKLWGKDIKSSLSELWVPCELTKAACLKAGFKGPIEVLPTPCLLGEDYSEIQVPSVHNNDLVLSDDVFKFYSVFQWNERKGYRTLLRAYYNAFDNNDNVVLILKVNPIKSKGHGISKVRSDIKKIARSTQRRLESLPKVFLSTDFLSRERLLGLHRLCDAFVLPHHGEGWGMPIHDAMMHNSYVISTKFGGITEYLSDENSFVVNHKIGPVKPMDWNPWYGNYQKWAYPSCADLTSIMTALYNNKDRYTDKLDNAHMFAKTLSVDSCAKQIEGILSKRRFKRYL